MMSVPVTKCELVDTPYRRVKDLTVEGIPEIPVLGMNRSIEATDGSIYHRHACLEITYCARGSVKFDCNGRAYSIIAGDVFISCPEDTHRLRSNPKGAKLYWIFLRLPQRGERFMGLDEKESKWLVDSLRALPRKAFPAPAEVGASYARLFTILDAEKSGSIARKLKLKIAAVHLLIALAEAGATAAEGVRDVRFQTLVDRMRREPKKAFSVAEIAAELRCSPNTVRVRFKKYTGHTPQSFMMKCRIHKAQDLLRAGKMTVTDIAYELEFSSPQNFAIRFRQETGKCPTAWQKENL